MDIALGFLITLIIVGLIVSGIWSVFAWSDGRDAVGRYRGYSGTNYDNNYMVPFNYVYDASYKRREERGTPLSRKSKNAARFGRAV